MSLIQAIILAIIEGITEFLPISSTGHMIIGSSVMGIASDHFVKMFTVAIQFGAILSVVVLYFKRFFQSVDFYVKLFVAFIPAAILGKLLNEKIDSLLENPVGVAIALLVGGVVLLFVDKWFAKNEDASGQPSGGAGSETAAATSEQKISYFSALKIGLFQAIAMIPGVSRSAASIIGGLTQGLNRKTAAEFSFFLAVPTMFAATVYKMYKYHKEFGFHKEDVSILLIGNIVAFVVAMLAIRFFIGFLTKHGFRIFGYYRIVLGGAILLLYLLGHNLTVI